MNRHDALRDHLLDAARQAGWFALREQTVSYRYVESGDSWRGATGRADLVVWASRWAWSRRRHPQWVIEVKNADLFGEDLWNAASQVNRYATVLNCRPVLVSPNASRQWCKGVDVMSPIDAVAMFEHELLFGHRNSREDIDRFFGFHGVTA